MSGAGFLLFRWTRRWPPCRNAFCSTSKCRCGPPRVSSLVFDMKKKAVVKTMYGVYTFISSTRCTCLFCLILGVAVSHGRRTQLADRRFGHRSESHGQEGDEQVAPRCDEGTSIVEIRQVCDGSGGVVVLILIILVLLCGCVVVFLRPLDFINGDH